MNILLPLIIISAGFFNDAQTPELVTTSDSVSTEPEPIVTEAIVPEAAEPLVVVPEATEPEATEPEAAEPEVTEPEVTEPEVTEPEAIEPEAIEPEATEPEATEPEATEPEAIEPEATEPEVTEPEATEPEGDVSTAVNADSWPRQTESDLCGSVGIGQNRPQQNGNCSYHEGLSDVDEAWSHLAPSTRAAILMLVEADQMTRTE